MSILVGFEGGDGNSAADLLAGQNRLLEMIATGAAVADVLDNLVRLIESQVEGMLCSVLLLDEDGRCLRHGAAPSLPEAYTKAIDGLFIGPKAGSCGTAAYRKQRVIVADILEDPLWEDYRDLATRHGLRACWSTPFFSHPGYVLGTFAMYYPDPRTPSPNESRLIDVAARIASIAVERWRSERERLRNAESYRALVENLNDIVFSVDLHGKFSYVSSPVERQFGYQASEIIGRGFSQFVHPEDLDLVRENVANALSGNPSPCEFRVLDKHGTMHWVRSSTRLQVAENQVVGITGSIADVTQQRQTQDALREAEQKYRAIFEESVVSMFRSEPSGRYLDGNSALARLFGFDSPEELIASVTDISQQLYVDPERRSDFRALMQKDGSVRNFECEVYRRDGSKIWILVHARAICEHGRIVAYEGMNEDITERKLLEKQLLQAQKMEAVGLLAAGVAHDFNNLLGVILGHGELLAERLDVSDPTRRRIDQIRQAGERAVSLTRQLLAFSRQQILQPVVLDLNLVVQNFDDIVGRLIGEDIRVRNQLDPALCCAMADRGQVEQILLNLAVNARDAMPKGGTLSIATANVELDQLFVQRHAGAKEGRYVSLVVSDTGMGMDHETLARIFEPFFTTKEPGKGTGLGLSTVYGIVKQSGGYISVASEVGKGTTFEIYLPMARETEEPLVNEVPSARAEAGCETVLLVEDATDVREVTREFLEVAGYQVLEASNAEEALRLAEAHGASISLLITDVVMRGMNGHLLAQRLKSVRPEIKVLYTSGYADDTVFRHGVVPSGVAFLPKPFTQAELGSKIRVMLDATG